MTEWENWQQHIRCRVPTQAGEMSFKDKPHWVTQSYTYSLMTESRGIQVFTLQFLTWCSKQSYQEKCFFLLKKIFMRGGKINMIILKTKTKATQQPRSVSEERAMSYASSNSK